MADFVRSDVSEDTRGGGKRITMKQAIRLAKDLLRTKKSPKIKKSAAQVCALYEEWAKD